MDLADGGFADSTWYTDGSLLDGCTGTTAVRVEGSVVKERISILYYFDQMFR
jgi:inorganic pyrophosphatase